MLLHIDKGRQAFHSFIITYIALNFRMYINQSPLFYQYYEKRLYNIYNTIKLQIQQEYMYTHGA